MKKMIIITINLLFLATNTILAEGGTVYLLFSTKLKPTERATIGLTALTPKTLYQITCSIGDPHNTDNQKGMINVVLSNADAQNVLVNNESVPYPVVNYALPSAPNSLVLGSITTDSAASYLIIKNQSTFPKQDITIDSCTATRLAVTA